MANWAQVERAALCDLLVEVGPDAPTLCEGWASRDLAAHLVLRERRPDAAPGIALPGPFRRWTGRVQARIAGKPYEELVAKVRNGPPRWMATRIPALDRLVNTGEMFVHHEDVRRAADGWEPRKLPDEEVDVLWSLLGRAKMLLRRSPVGVTLQSPGREQVVAKKGEQAATISGEPGEILLFAFGRGDHARVEVTGDDDTVAALHSTDLGL